MAEKKTAERNEERYEERPPDRDERNRDDVREHMSSTGLADGAANSEHANETRGMRHGPEENEKRRQAAERAGDVEEPGPNRLRTTSKTDLEKHMEEKGEGRMAARTPQEMSLHQELDQSDKGPDDVIEEDSEHGQ